MIAIAWICIAFSLWLFVSALANWDWYKAIMDFAAAETLFGENATRWRSDAERELIMYLDDYDRKWPSPQLRDMYERHLERGGPA